jgi:hypothetical protein
MFMDALASEAIGAGPRIRPSRLHNAHMFTKELEKWTKSS